MSRPSLLNQSFVVGIIGMGNMGEHLAKMFLYRPIFSLKRVSVIGSCRREERAVQLNDSLSLGNGICTSNKSVASRSDVVILAVKPAQIKDVCHEIGPSLTPDTIVISVAAAVSLNKLKEWLPNIGNIVRCMPNIPCCIGKGIVPYYSDISKSTLFSIMSTVFEPNEVILLD